MFKQLIFDCDGVLVDTEIVAAEVVTKVMKQYGSEITLNEYLRHCTGKLISEVFGTLPKENTEGVDMNKLMHECEENIYARLRPVKGVAEIIKDLPLNKSVVSNSALWQVEKAISHLSLEQIFQKRYFSSEMVSLPKPAPDIYLHAAEALKTPVDECLVVEDSKAGVTAAAAAGMTVIGFTGASHIQEGHDTALMDLGAVQVVSTPEALKQAILKLTE